MNALRFSLYQAHVVLSRTRSAALLIVHTTPHVGSSTFMRQLARNPTLRAPREEEAERRTVASSAETFKVLQRYGLSLNLIQREQVQAFFKEDGHATV